MKHRNIAVYVDLLVASQVPCLAWIKAKQWEISQLMYMKDLHNNWATKKKKSYYPLYWLFQRDPYVMVYEIIPI